MTDTKRCEVDVTAKFEIQLSSGVSFTVPANDAGQDQCGHCGYAWHGLPLDACPGSTFIGPRAPTSREQAHAKFAQQVNQVAGFFQLPPDPWLSSDSEPETPQQRALPRPSTTPPMWAQQPNQRRRNRRM